jgi:hypothetical protein
MSNYNRDDLDAKALRRLLNSEQLTDLSELVGRGSELLFDSVAGQGCWKRELTDDQRRAICQRIMVRMVGELFRAERFSSYRSSTLH